MAQDPQRNLPRRLFLSTGGMAATATAVGLGLTEDALAQNTTTLSPFWHENWIEVIAVPAGRLRIARLPVESEGVPRGKRVVVPLYLETTHNASIDFINPGTPIIRFGTATQQFTLSKDGIKFPDDRVPAAWTSSNIKRLLTVFTDVLRDDPQAESARLTQSLFSLRSALDSCWFTAFRADDAWPLGGNSAAKILGAMESRISSFAEKPHPDGCRLETIVETVEKQVTRQVQEIVQSAKSLAQCLANCEPWNLLCQGKCLTKHTFGTFSATVEIVETLVESVTKEVLVCPEKLPENFIPSPLFGLAEIPAEFRKQVVPREVLPQIDDQMVSNVVRLLRGMTVDEFREAFLGEACDENQPPVAEISGLLKTVADAIMKLPPVVKCVIFEGQWSLKALEDIGITTAGIRSVPYRVEVCVSSGCKQKIHDAGGLDTFRVAAELLLSFGKVVAVVAFLAVFEPLLGKVVGTILFLIIAALAELMLHLVATAGRIFWLELMGMLQDEQGICLTHPSIVPLSDLQELSLSEFLNLLLINGPPLPGPRVSPAPL